MVTGRLHDASTRQKFHGFDAPPMRDADVDAAAEDPPLGPLAGALLGVLAAAAGVGWLVLSLVLGVPGSIGIQVVLAIGGFVAFVASMLWWSPQV